MPESPLRSNVVDKQTKKEINTILNSLPTATAYHEDELKIGHKNPNRENIKRKGFYYALQQQNCPMNELESLLQRQEDQKKTDIGNSKKIFDRAIEDIKRRILIIEEQIRVLKEPKAQKKEEKEKLDTETILLKKELESLYKKQADIRWALAQKKEVVVNGLTNQANKEVAEALKIPNTVYDETLTLHKKMFENRKSGYSKWLEVLEAQKTILKERQSIINERINVLTSEGTDIFISDWLYILGIITVTASALLFSVFTGSTLFGSNTISEFIFDSLFKATTNNSVGWLSKMAIWLVLIIGITFICWLANWLLQESLKQNSPKDQFGHTFFVQTESEDAGASVRANNLYQFWLGIAPLVLVAGIIILILSLDENITNKINILNASVDGVLIGSGLVMGLCGVVYLYITKVIEPRLIARQQMNQEKSKRSWIKNNWELTACLVVFLVCIFLIIFLQNNNSSPTKINSTNDNPTIDNIHTALLAFVASSLLASISMGYSLRCRGLMKLEDKLLQQLIHIQSSIEECTQPKSPAISTNYYQQLNHIMFKTLERIGDKAGYYNTKIADEEKNYNNKGNNTLNILYTFLQINKGGKKSQTTGYEENDNILSKINSWEAYFFPEQNEQLKQVSVEISRKEEQLKDTETKLNTLKNEEIIKTDHQQDKIDALQNQIEAMNLDATQVAKLQHNYERIQYENLDYEKTWLTEGFHLGLWYRECDMGPANKFYLSCITNHHGTN